MENFRSVTESLGEIRRISRHDHEFLEIDGCIGMCARIQNVHHRHRQNLGLGATEITKEGKIRGRRGRIGYGK